MPLSPRKPLRLIGVGLIVVVLGAALALSGCTTTRTTKPAETSAHAFDDIVAAAHRQLLEKYPHPEHPGTHPVNFTRPPRVTRYDDRWEVTWEWPRDVNMTGGAPLVRLERDDLSFISATFYE